MHGGTDPPHYSLVNLLGVIEPSLGLDLIDPRSSFFLNFPTLHMNIYIYSNISGCHVTHTHSILTDGQIKLAHIKPRPSVPHPLLLLPLLTYGKITLAHSTS